jgi:predicted Rossmann-fold nucleotide-binding protein
VAAVCVFCGSSTTLAPEFLELAAALGTELARRAGDGGGGMQHVPVETGPLEG